MGQGDKLCIEWILCDRNIYIVEHCVFVGYLFVDDRHIRNISLLTITDVILRYL